MINQMLIFLFR